jgi:hypothetical protein
MMQLAIFVVLLAICMLVILKIDNKISARGGGKTKFLCDLCTYDDERGCHRPERPNARKCPDFRRR